MCGHLRLLNIACAAKAKPRLVTLTKPSRDSPLAFSLLGGQEKGFRIFIDAVEPGSKAAEAGLKRGDQVRVLIAVFALKDKILRRLCRQQLFFFHFFDWSYYPISIWTLFNLPAIWKTLEINPSGQSYRPLHVLIFFAPRWSSFLLWNWFCIFFQVALKEFFWEVLNWTCQ